MKNTFDQPRMNHRMKAFKYFILRETIKSLPERLLNKFFGAFSFEIQSIPESIKECLALNVDPEIQKNILCCILHVYKLELKLRDKEYNPTIFGIALPFKLELGVSKTDELAALDDLFNVLSGTMSLHGALEKNTNALTQSIPREFYIALEAIQGRECVADHVRFETNNGLRL